MIIEATLVHDECGFEGRVRVEEGGTFTCPGCGDRLEFDSDPTLKPSERGDVTIEHVESEES